MMMVSPDNEVTIGWHTARPDLDTSPMRVFGRFKQLQAAHELALEPIYEGAPLNPPELDILVILRHATEPVIARQLARKRGCSRAAISKTLGKLEQRGLIAREPNPVDRRAALVRISEHGAAVVDQIFPRQLATEAELLATLTEAERQAIVDAFDMLLRAMSRYVD